MTSKSNIYTVDTDVLVIVVASTFRELHWNELWVALGTGKHIQYILVHSIMSYIGKRKAKALPTFHVFTGFD